MCPNFLVAITPSSLVLINQPRRSVQKSKQSHFSRPNFTRTGQLAQANPEREPQLTIMAVSRT